MGKNCADPATAKELALMWLAVIQDCTENYIIGNHTHTHTKQVAALQSVQLLIMLQSQHILVLQFEWS